MPITVLCAGQRGFSLEIRDKEKVSSVIKRASSAWALVPEDWTLHYGLKRLGDNEAVKRYLDVWGVTAFRLVPKAVSCSLANPAQRPSPRVKRESSPERDLLPPADTSTSRASSRDLLTSANPSTNSGSSTEVSSLMAPTRPPTITGRSTGSPAARITALKELNDASKELETATTSDRDITTSITDFTERKRELDELLGSLEAARVQASERIAEAERAMRAAWEKMGAALGSRTG